MREFHGLFWYHLSLKILVLSSSSFYWLLSSLLTDILSSCSCLVWLFQKWLDFLFEWFLTICCWENNKDVGYIRRRQFNLRKKWNKSIQFWLGMKPHLSILKKSYCSSFLFYSFIFLLRILESFWLILKITLLIFGEKGRRKNI